MRVYVFWILLLFCTLNNYVFAIDDDDDDREVMLVGDKNYSNNSNFTYDGIDVSNYQKDIKWEATASDRNIKYVYIKATEGATHKQHRYRYNLENARKHGVKVGSYHFMRTGTSIQSQFNNFISIVKREEQDLIPLLDVETREGWTIKQLQDSVLKFARLLEQHFGCKPMIYCNSSYFNNYLGSVFADYPLFIARYSKSEPQLYYGAKWILWQFSDRGRIDGIDALVDLSRFNRGCSIKDIAYKSITRSRTRRDTRRDDVPRPKIRHDEKPPVPYPNKYNANVPQSQTKEQREIQKRGEEAARKRQEMEKRRLEEERKAEEKLRKEEEKKRKEIEKRQKEIEKRRAAEEKKRQEEEKKRLEQEKKRQREEAKQNARQQAQNRMKAEKEMTAQNEKNQKQEAEQKRRNELEQAKQERLNQEKQHSSAQQTPNAGTKQKNTPKVNNQSSADNDAIHYNKKKKTVW